MSAEFDLDDFLRLLANRCVRLLDVDAASVFLVDHGVAASSDRVAELESSALRYEEGPARDCCDAGAPVVAPDLTTASTRWPRYAADTRAAGYAATYTLPMRRRTEQIGALTLFRSAPGEPAKADARLAKAMAEVATIGILQTRAVRRQETLAAQLQHALNSRVVIEQAKGVLAERLGLTMSAAFAALRNYARSHNTRVAELASSVVDGRFDTNLLRG